MENTLKRLNENDRVDIKNYFDIRLIMRLENFNQFLPLKSKVQIETVTGSRDLTEQAEHDLERPKSSLAQKGSRRDVNFDQENRRFI